MSFPKYVVGGPLTIKGQRIEMHNNGNGSATHGYTVASMYGAPVSAQWHGDSMQFTTDKGKTFITNDSTLKTIK